MVQPVARPFDYHRMTLLPRIKAADAAHAALDPLQQLSPEEMVMGSALLFATLTKRCGLDAGELYAMATRVLAAEPFHKRANDSLQSLQDFAGLRIKGEHNVSIS